MAHLRRCSAALLVAALLTGCGAVRAYLHVQRAIEAAGFRGVRVSLTTNDRETVIVVSYRPDVLSAEALHADADRIARIVWHEAPLRFDVLSVRGTGRVFAGTFSRPQLQELFGPRDPALDKDPDDLINARGIVLGVVALGVVGVVAVVVIVVVIVRSSRRPAAVWTGPTAGTWGPPPPPGGWAPPPHGWTPPPGPTPDDPFRTPPG